MQTRTALARLSRQDLREHALAGFVRPLLFLLLRSLSATGGALIGM